MLIVEDGSIVEDANCYISLNDADAYLIPRGVWGESTTTEIEDRKEQAIIRATDYMNTLYWKGVKVSLEQELSFPRVGYDGIPKAIIKANAEIAGLFFNGTDLLAPAQQGVMIKSEKVDVIEESVHYFENAPSVPLYGVFVGILRPYLVTIFGEKGGFEIIKVDY